MGRLLVHGWMVTGGVWNELASKLGVPTAAPTLVPPPSLVPTTTLETLAAVVLDEATRAGFERFHLVGHSMGGQIAQLAAAMGKGRVRSLSLVNSVPLSGLALPPDVAAVFRSSGDNRTAQAAIVDQACLELTPKAKDALLADAATIAPAWIARAFDLFSKGDDPAKLAEISCPTLVVATSDPFLPPSFLEQTIVSKIAGAKLAVLEGPGHYPQIERPDALASVLRAFLDEVERR
ncbi:MAG TPA: alpha/beta hydrolase [Labilithrix sp.]|nr:alpha/beta hydrolase [Labilithrix sp.]